MPERYYSESPDSFEDERQESDLEFIRKDLENIFSHGFSGDSQTEDLEIQPSKMLMFSFMIV